MTFAQAEQLAAMDAKPGSVLLVEDSEDDVTLVQQAFKKMEIMHALRIVRDGAQAMDYLERQGIYVDHCKFPLPAFVLLDLRMPGMDGFEVLNWVRNQSAFRRLPITVFTGSEFPQDIERAYALGANSFIQKPITFDKLHNSLCTVADFWLGCCKLPQVANNSADEDKA